MSMSVDTLRRRMIGDVLVPALPVVPRMRRREDLSTYAERLPRAIVSASRAVMRLPLDVLTDQSYGVGAYQKELDRWSKLAFPQAVTVHLDAELRHAADVELLAIARALGVLPEEAETRTTPGQHSASPRQDGSSRAVFPAPCTARAIPEHTGG